MILEELENIKINEIADKLGKENILCQLSEECSELIKAISKCKRYGCVDKYRDNLIEEIADVLIIINELQLIYDISNDDIENIKKYKIDRMDYRIKNNL